MSAILDCSGPAIWRASWQAALLAVLVALVLRCLGQRVPARWRYLLWSVVVIRFLLVVAPVSPWSLFNLLQHEQQVASGGIVAPEPEPAAASERAGVPLRTAVSDASPAALPPRVETSAQDGVADGTGLAGGTAIAPVAQPETGRRVAHSSEPTYSGFSLGRILTVAWLAGCVALGIRLWLAAWVLRHRLSACRRVADTAIVNLLEETGRQVGLRRTPLLLVSPETISPCVAGTWRPKIIVPESILTDLSQVQLRQVFAHELAHLLRGDLWANWLMLAARTLHWFNPLAWWTVREMQTEREAACDELALRALHGAERSTYVETILELASGLSPSPMAPGMIGLFSSRRSLARRMERILRSRPARPVSSVFAAGLVLLLALVGLTDAMPVGPAEEPAGEEAVKTASESSPAGAARPQSAEHTIRGRCIDRKDKSPLAGVRLSLYVVRGLVALPEKIGETVSDEEGRFEFTGLRPPRPDGRLDRVRYGIVGQAEGRPSDLADEWWFRSQGRQEVEVVLGREAATLAGRITNEKGEPVAGATILQHTLDERPIPGILSAISDAGGHFAITDVSAWKPRPDSLGRGAGFRVRHPDYPRIWTHAPMLPAEIEVTLPTGCTLTGTVRDGVTGEAAAGVVVTAQTMAGGEDARAVTDEAGRFRFVVAEGNYNILAEAEDRVCAAIADQECQTGQTIELEPLEMRPGGFLTGRVLDASTGEPVVLNEEGHPITVGLWGPSRPAQKVIDQIPLTEVDDEGRFVLRAAPGENFPYLVNMRGKRMAWNTRKQEPAIVEEGKTAHLDILIEREIPPAEKLTAAKEVLAGLSEEPKERVGQIIEEFRKLNHTVDETELWCLLMRELVTIGPDALPQLCAELDQTTEQRMIRRLGFALRAIGDPRAVPALIRAIPKTLLPSSSDYGLIVEDKELTAFMQEHDLDSGRGRHFDLGRPIREVFGALHHLTGQDFEDATLYSVSRSEAPQAQILQRRLFRRQAERWQAWWEAHWHEFTDDESYRLVKLTVEDEASPAAPVTLGPNAKTGGGVIGATLSPASHKGKHVTHFLDLDTGLRPKWPEHIPQEEAAAQQGELALWAAQNGVDLMCVEYHPREGAPVYALRAFNMRLWEIRAIDARNIDKRVRDGKLPEGQPVGELLLHYDPESHRYAPEENAAFLYVTREGGIGLIEVTDRVTRTANLAGWFGDPPKGVGFRKGVRFNLKTITP